MATFRTFASMTLAALLGSSTAFAQTDTRETSQNANPHSTLNKDRPASGTPAATTKAEMQDAESANPHSTLNKDQSNEGPATAQGVLERIATADRGEIAMGKLAQENGSARVQQLGKMLEQDHGTSLAEVQALAKKKSLTLSGKDSMAKHEMEEAHEMNGTLAKLHGAEFDKAFARAMTEDHRKDIGNLKKWQMAVNDKEVAALIEKSLPVLERHLAAAQSLRTPAAQGRTP